MDGLDPKVTNPSLVSRTFLELKWIIDILAGGRSSIDIPIIVILDCCRIECGPNVMEGTTRIRHELERHGPSNIFILFATAEGDIAADGPEHENGVLTKSLLKHMKMGGDIVAVSQAITNDLIRERGQVGITPAKKCSHL